MPFWGTVHKSCTSWPACILLIGWVVFCGFVSCGFIRLFSGFNFEFKASVCVVQSREGPWFIGFSYEQLEDPQQAIEWLMQVISVVPTDPQALAKLGELHDGEGDKSQAFHYYYEVCGAQLFFKYLFVDKLWIWFLCCRIVFLQSFRYFPSNIDVIEWLGAYYIETQFCEKAIQYFQRATLIQ